MTHSVVRVSNAAGCRYFFVVLAVDFELRLFGDALEVFDAGKNSAPSEIEIQAGPLYSVRYNNNDGASGLLHIRVVEERTDRRTCFEVNRSTITGPTVVEETFRLHAALP